MGFHPDEKTKQAISRIIEKKELANILAVSLGVSTIGTLFFRNNSLQAAYAIQGTDWKLWSNAMASIPNIYRRAVKAEAWAMWNEYQKPYNHSHSTFWKMIAEGACDEQ